MMWEQVPERMLSYSSSSDLWSCDSLDSRSPTSSSASDIFTEVKSRVVEILNWQWSDRTVVLSLPGCLASESQRSPFQDSALLVGQTQWQHHMPSKQASPKTVLQERRWQRTCQFWHPNCKHPAHSSIQGTPHQSQMVRKTIELRLPDWSSTMYAQPQWMSRTFLASIHVAFECKKHKKKEFKCSHWLQGTFNWHIFLKLFMHDFLSFNEKTWWVSLWGK